MYDEKPIVYNIVVKEDRRWERASLNAVQETDLICNFIGATQALLSYYYVCRDGEEWLERLVYPDVVDQFEYTHLLDFKDKCRDIDYKPNPAEIFECVVQSFELNKTFVEGFEEDIQEFYPEFIKLVEKRLFDLFSTDESDRDFYNFFKHIDSYYVWSYYKDLDGIYCEKCKRWLLAEYTDGVIDFEPFDQDFYIVSDKLEPCPECVAVRNGDYEYLSNFTIVKKEFDKRKGSAKRELRDYLRVPFLKKFAEDEKINKIVIDWKKVYDGPGILYDDSKTFIVRKKYRNKDLFSIKLDKNEIIGFIISRFQGGCLSRKTINKIVKRSQIFRDKPVLKYVVIKEFGNDKDKRKLYNHYMKNCKIFQILDYITIEDFFDDIGFELVKGFYESKLNNSLFTEFYDQKELGMLTAIYDTTGDIYQRLQMYYYYRLK